MTVDEFKKLKPEYKDLEGDALWDAMTDYMLRQQEGSEIIKQIMPIWKTHTFRWLFYRNKKGWTLHTNPRHASQRCIECKKGVSSRFGMIYTQKDGTTKYISYCPHCSKEYKEEPNTNLSYKAHLISRSISQMFWKFLDKIHLIRTGSRYGMFGDEARYVKAWYYDENFTHETPVHKKRKWWEYILIERPIHNF